MQLVVMRFASFSATDSTIVNKLRIVTAVLGNQLTANIALKVGMALAASRQLLVHLLRFALPSGGRYRQMVGRFAPVCPL